MGIPREHSGEPPGVTYRLPEQPGSSTGLPSNLAAVLAYSAWWISGLLLWWVERRDRFVRFHAVQASIGFGIVTLITLAFTGLAVLSLAALPEAFVPFLWAAGLTWVGGEVLWLAAIWQAARGRWWRMPLVASWAERWSIGDW